MWAENDLEIFAKADLLTPDGRSQWFSDFLFVDGRHGERKGVHIQRKYSAVATPQHDTLNTLSVIIFDEEKQNTSITNPGTYQIGALHVVVTRDGKMIGHLPREVVVAKYGPSSFLVSSERAKKFGANDKAVAYTHLDFDVVQMSSNVKRGVLAELWGFIPMTPKTASMIKRTSQVAV